MAGKAKRRNAATERVKGNCFDAFPERSQQKIIQVRPGLSGIGSIVFRDEENLMHQSADPDTFYDQVIMPCKGLLEEWYVEHQSLSVYLKCIWLTKKMGTEAILVRVRPEGSVIPPESVAINPMQPNEEGMMTDGRVNFPTLAAAGYEKAC